MRIIEPPKRHKKKRIKNRFFISLLIILLAGASVFAYFKLYHKTDSSGSSSAAVLAETEQAAQQNTNPSDGDFKYFSGPEFLTLYQNIAYPNTEHLREQPVITGNEAADARIKTIAESRGYVLRSVPIYSINKTNEPRLADDDLLQEKALVAWHELKDAAKAAGIPLQLNSGYRSIEMQRELFLSRLKATGVTYAQIAAGQADNQVVATLHMTAPPGYSRHHTGYTVDFVCANGYQSFEVTTCFKWLSDNNYLNAKKHGWIPSYPEGTSNQGPEPEPWEYVWVGKQALLKE